MKHHVSTPEPISGQHMFVCHLNILVKFEGQKLRQKENNFLHSWSHFWAIFCNLLNVNPVFVKFRSSSKLKVMSGVKNLFARGYIFCSVWELLYIKKNWVACMLSLHVNKEVKQFFCRIPLMEWSPWHRVQCSRNRSIMLILFLS